MIRCAVMPFGRSRKPNEIAKCRDDTPCKSIILAKSGTALKEAAVSVLR